jgi:hypothetical protein
MSKLLSILLAISICYACYGQTEKKITILHTNDLHSHLQGFAPESNYSPMSINDDRSIGGFSRIATIIKKEKEWLALMELLSAMKDTDGNGIPDIDNKYKEPVKSFYKINAK